MVLEPLVFILILLINFISQLEGTDSMTNPMFINCNRIYQVFYLYIRFLLYIFSFNNCYLFLYIYVY